MKSSLTALAAALLFTSPVRADVLVDNVNGLTLDTKGQIERFSGLLIGNDGRVEQILRKGDKRPGKVDFMVDGKGRVLMPGIVDGHAEVIELGFTTLTLDLSTTRSLMEAQGRVTAYAAAHPDRAWVLGRGWDETRWGTGIFPTVADLDAASGARPAWLVRADGEAGWANSRALAIAGITATSKDPADGRIGRLPGSNQPSGVLFGSAMGLVEKIVPAPRPEDRDLAFEEAQKVLLGQGITAVTDMGTTIEDWQSYRRAGDSGRLRMRIMAYAGGIDAMRLIGGPGPTPWLYDDRLRLNGVVLDLDGSLSGHGASLKVPYADMPDSKGYRWLGDTQLRNLMSRGAFDNFQVAVQSSGDAAVGSTLDAVEELVHTYKGDRRWRIERLATIDVNDLARLSRNGVIASVQPTPQFADRTTLESRLGTARMTGTLAWNSISTAGAKLAFGSGAPASTPRPFDAMADATTRQDGTAQPAGGWQPQERLTREVALAAVTTGPAYAGFAEGRFGRLNKGARADFILIDRDPTQATPAELRATRVLQTWVNGQMVFKAEDAPKH